MTTRRNIISKILPVVVWILIQDARSSTRIDPLVDTNVGLLRGLQATDGEYAKFTGIPYAILDKDNPFGPALPHPGFDGVFEAYSDSVLCPQMDALGFEATGTLECLQLNVYVPNTASSRNRLPVLVWIHGGGFAFGESGATSYGPTYLVRHDVILVTLNYRLGPYGFMCLHTPEVPGNQGLKDQLLALKWVKDNIEAFGGDTSKVTLFGESAGGASVDLHLYYNEQKLFDKVIFQSGNALCPWGVLEPDLASHIKLADHLGFESDNHQDPLIFLSKTDPNLVIAAAQYLNLVFRPCVEKDFINVTKFMTVHPFNTNITRNDYSVLIGHNNDESYVNRLNDDINVLRGLIDAYLVEHFNFDTEELMENEQLIKHFYMGDEEITEDYRQAITDFSSDFLFNYPTARSILTYLENGAKSVFHYVFSYNGGRNYYKNLANVTSGGAAHADELGYLFTQTSNLEDPSHEDWVIIDRITTLWTNFAKYGNPTPVTNDLLPVTWTPVTKDIFSYMNIDSELCIKRRPFHDRMAFWDLFYKMNKKAQKGYQ